MPGGHVQAAAGVLGVGVTPGSGGHGGAPMKWAVLVQRARPPSGASCHLFGGSLAGKAFLSSVEVMNSLRHAFQPFE